MPNHRPDFVIVSSIGIYLQLSGRGGIFYPFVGDPRYQGGRGARRGLKGREEDGVAGPLVTSRPWETRCKAVQFFLKGRCVLCF